MKLTLNRIYTFLFFVGLFFLPFNSWEGIKEFGEFKREAPAIFLLAGFLVLSIEILYSGKIEIPHKSYIFKLVLIFLIWCIVTTILNAPFVLDAYYKQTSGVMRFIRQYFALVLSCILFFLVYWYSISRMTNKQILFSIRKVLLMSFIVVTIYGFLEIAHAVFGFFPAYTLLRLFDYFPFTEYDFDINNRISSVSWEAPALATYLITVSGWMFSYILTNKTFTKYIPTIIVLILTYYSGSRTALIVIIVQLFIFLAIILTRQQKIKFFLCFSVMMIFLSSFLMITDGEKIIRNIEEKVESLDFKGNLKNNISNQSRFGIQYANLVVFSENPIVGVGFGQQGFHAINHYPAWAKKDNYEFKVMYLNKKNPMFPPGYNIYVRLLAETGIIGFFLFIYILYTIFKYLLKGLKNHQNETRILDVILIISFAGYAINWLQMDTFRIYGFWFCLAIFAKTSSKIFQKVINN